jgi:hypothetical protein
MSTREQLIHRIGFVQLVRLGLHPLGAWDVSSRLIVFRPSSMV